MQRLWALEDGGISACTSLCWFHWTPCYQLGEGWTFLALPLGRMSICAGGNRSNHGASGKLPNWLTTCHFFQVCWPSRTQTQETGFLLLAGLHSSGYTNHDDSLQHPRSGLTGHNPGRGPTVILVTVTVIFVRFWRHRLGANPAATRSGTPSDRLEH